MAFMDFMHLDAALASVVCTMIPATTLLNVCMLHYL